MSLTASEAIVEELCRRSFLTLWSEANPIVRPGKELCDLLVVCDPDVVIFSVKEIALKNTGTPQVDWQRWRKKAIDESTKQISGAERWVRKATRVIRTDGSPGLALPFADTIRVHRVAVALGGEGKVPYKQGDFGKGFVHVLDEQSLNAVLTELDTISDFVDYLAAKEAFLRTGMVVFAGGQEEDLLALYLHNGRRFPEGPDLLMIGDGLWASITQKHEWLARKEADRESYVWDGLIETLHRLNSTDASAADAIDTLDSALRVMARENRFARRVLARGFNEFMGAAAAARTRARICPSLSGVHYVFLATARGESRDERRQELALRCFVARGRQGAEGNTVVGIATERYVPNAGFSMDAVRLTKSEWDEDDQANFEGIQRDLGYFAAPMWTRMSDDEFPTQPSTFSGTGQNAPCPCGSGIKYQECHGRHP